MGTERIIVATAYMILGVVIFARQRGLIRPLIRDGFKTSYRDLGGREIVGERPGGPGGHRYHRSSGSPCVPRTAERRG
jgi:hypothetical protein